jgi:PAS domain S-box-containing protein
MGEIEPQSLWRRDPRLAALALNAHPAWLWATSGTRVLWANAAGAAILAPGGSSPTSAPPPRTAAAQIERIAATLTRGAPARLERLRDLGAGVGRPLTCACQRIGFGPDADAVLVTAVERAGPDLTLRQRVARLVAGCDQPVAAFWPDGGLIDANACAHALLDGRASLAALDATALAAIALRDGHALGRAGDPIGALDRLGQNEIVLIATLAPRPETPTSAADVAPAALIDSAAAKPWLHPLRFVWQMDAALHLTLESRESSEFLDLIGDRAASWLGRPWPEISAALGLDPEGQIERALTTRETFSGLTVTWPAEGSAERLAIELSGLPVFDRERAFLGYRGFGVCRDLSGLTALAAQRRRQAANAPPPGAVPAPPALAGTGNTAPPAIVAAPPDAEPPALSLVERSAFRELALRLTESVARPQPAQDPVASLDDGAPARGKPPRATALRPADRESIEPDLFGDFTADRPAALACDPRPLLDRLPVGMLVYRGRQLLHANPIFLDWAGFDSLASLVAAGGLDAIDIAPGARLDGNRLAIASRRGQRSGTTAALVEVPWSHETACALVLTAADLPRPDPAPAPLRGETTPAAGRLPAEFTSIRPSATPMPPRQAEADELRAILDTATDGVVVLDRCGQILSLSRSAEALFGSTSAALAGRNFADLFAPESQSVALEYLEGLLRNEVDSLINDGREVIGCERRGGLIPLFMTMGRIGDDGKRLCAVFRDTTPWLRNHQDAGDGRRQAQRDSSAHSDFLAKISHEIRTPLNSIIGFSELMKEERFGPLGNERYRQYLKDIHASGGQLLALINDLINLSRIEAGRIELTFGSLALNDVIQQGVAMLQAQANRERVIIRTSLAVNLPLVIADARTVRQIVLNLLSNSIGITGAGRQVIVSTALTEAGAVVLRVRDTGFGMSENEIALAREPFRQIATATRAGMVGGGLSLPLTKALAEANRATFAISSTPDCGTLIEIGFPPGQLLAE